INDNFLGLRTSQLSVPVQAGTTYMISVSGATGVEGFLQLNWRLNPLAANDNFANATVLNATNLWGTNIDNNMGATAEPGEPTHAGFAPSSSLWYKLVAPADGEIEVDTIGSSIDTVLGVYTGTGVGSLNQVAANDDLFISFPQPGIGQFPQTNISAQNFDMT